MQVLKTIKSRVEDDDLVFYSPLSLNFILSINDNYIFRYMILFYSTFFI
jgi:hypothetical protein